MTYLGLGKLLRLMRKRFPPSFDNELSRSFLPTPHPAGGRVRALVIGNALSFERISNRLLHHLHPLQLKILETAAAHGWRGLALLRENAGSAAFSSSIREYTGITQNGRGVYACGGLWICRKPGCSLPFLCSALPAQSYPQPVAGLYFQLSPVSTTIFP